jgi:hypothetical protein
MRIKAIPPIHMISSTSGVMYFTACILYLFPFRDFPVKEIYSIRKCKACEANGEYHQQSIIIYSFYKVPEYPHFDHSLSSN